jgi:hypothetical protein
VRSTPILEQRGEESLAVGDALHVGRHRIERLLETKHALAELLDLTVGPGALAPGTSDRAAEDACRDNQDEKAHDMARIEGRPMQSSPKSGSGWPASRLGVRPSDIRFDRIPTRLAAV